MADLTPEREKSKLLLRIGQFGFIGLALFGLIELSRVNFLWFHSLVEIFAIIIAFSIFIVTWNAQSYLDSPALLLIGISYLFVAGLDLLHVLVYQTSDSLTGASANLAIQAWIGARLLQAGSLAIAGLYTRRNFHPGLVLAIYALLTTLLVGSILAWGLFPAVYVPGQGLTPFKLGSEYLISFLMVVALALFVRRRDDFHPEVVRYLVFSVGASVAAEISLIGYVDTYSLPVVFGHLAKILSFACIYKAITETGLVRPYRLLFHNLQQSRDDLRRERDFVAAILDTTNALVVVVDASARMLRANRTFEESTGRSLAELSGQTLWGADLFGDQAPTLQNLIEKNLVGPTSFHYEGYLNTARDRKLLVAWDVAIRANEAGQVEYITMTGLDITDRKQTEDELRFLSTHDALTTLYNRSYFELEMIRLAETDKFPASIVIADVDGLKAINDTYGHLAGDKLLQRAAHILRSAFRTEDVIARMGGDEFAVLLADADEIVAEHAQRRVRAILAAHNQVNPDFQIGVSLGAATAIAGYMLMETYKHADRRMYQDKQQHKTHGNPQTP